MTILICPDCGDVEIDESDLCAFCSEVFNSDCDCERREQCESCAAEEDLGGGCKLGGPAPCIDDICHALGGCMHYAGDVQP